MEDIIDIIKQYIEVEKAVVFGSRARGDDKKASDIDIALFGENLTHTINTKIFYKLDELYMPYKIDLINFNTLGEENKIRENFDFTGTPILLKFKNKKED